LLETIEARLAAEWETIGEPVQVKPFRGPDAHLSHAISLNPGGTLQRFHTGVIQRIVQDEQSHREPVGVGWG
jgi:hypothetical protein